MTMTTIQELQADKLHVQTILEECNEWEKLAANKMFKKLVLTDYIEEGTTRLVGALATADEDMKKPLYSQLEAISAFKHHMTHKTQLKQAAEAKLIEIEEAIADELHAELNTSYEG